MEILASFFDPANNGFDLVDVAQIIALVVAIIAAWAGFDKWRSKRVAATRAKERKEMQAAIEKVISDRTQQIQPDANGGLALSDVAKGVKELGRRMDIIAGRLHDIDEKFTARMDASDAVRSVILSQVAADREKWVRMLSEQGIDVPSDGVRYMRGEL